jgi:hypothetical protein
MYITPPEHLNFFSSDGLVALFQRHGFACSKLHTVSRLNVARVARRIPVPGVGRLAAWSILQAVLLSDSVGGGMFVNGYFRRPNPS